MICTEMDVTKMRVDFSKHLLLLDDLNKQLTEHVSGESSITAAPNENSTINGYI